MNKIPYVKGYGLGDEEKDMAPRQCSCRLNIAVGDAMPPRSTTTTIAQGAAQ